MPITDSEILVKYSVKTGTAGNTTAGTANGSLGKYVSTTQMPDATLNGLFDDVSGLENQASEAEYRCIFIHNNHATLTWISPVVWVSAEVAGGANVAIAVDNIAASAVGATAAQAAEVANEDTAPTGVSAFSTPTTEGTGLALSNIGPGQVKAIWVRRTATNSSALNNDGATLSFAGDTNQ